MRVDDSRGGATTPGRLLSLAAGTVRELDPVATVAAAADAGWPAVGLAVDPDHWGPATTRQVRRRLERTGTVVLDVEAVFVTPAGDPGDLVVDVAAEVGARCVLVVGLGIDLAAFTDRFAALCGRAAPAGVTCVVEFMPILAIPDLETALSVVTSAAQPNAGILVDALHLARSGGTPADLRRVDARWLPYVQVCDAAAARPADLLEEALEGRLLPGEGHLPLRELLATLDAHAPAAALSVEVLSGPLRTAVPDPCDRARVVLAATRRALTAGSPSPATRDGGTERRSGLAVDTRRPEALR
jgi:sugar phosphate isomerase/epimerase